LKEFNKLTNERSAIFEVLRTNLRAEGTRLLTNGTVLEQYMKRILEEMNEYGVENVSTN